jgi:acyl CoA:acetate/3-ketoacid CoA transferase beta subunit
VLDITEDGFLLIETAPGVSIDHVRSRTLGKMQVSENVKEMQL